MDIVGPLTLSSLDLSLSSSYTTSCRNSRLVVYDADLKWVTNTKKDMLLLEQFHANFHSKGIK